MVSDAHPSEPNWDDLEQQFGTDPIRAIDQAVSAQLAVHRFGIKPDDYYLASEGLTYAVLMALRDAGVRFQQSVVEMPRRKACPVCGHMAAITKNGNVRSHRRADGVHGTCPTSRLPEFRGGA